MKLCWDIESDGLNHTRVWCLAVIDVDSGDEYFFTDHDSRYPSMAKGIELLQKASVHIGHNLIGFDIPALNKYYGFEVSSNQKVIDTMLLSQLNDFYRPSLNKASKIGGRGTHAMKTWGIALGDHKHDDPDWNEYSPEMMERCVSDVVINIKIYKYLMHESKQIRKVTPGYGDAIRLEHEFAMAASEQSKNGWQFDTELATSLVERITKKMDKIASEVEPHLEPRTVYLDKEPREVKYLKDGRMDRVSREWFADKPLESTYRRFKVVSTDLGNNDAVQKLLLANGWIPTEYNYKIDENGNKIRMSPKLTEDSYESIKGELGKLVGEWRTLRSRRSQLEGLIKLCDERGRVSCDAFTIGTNTFRCRHKGIVNIPGNHALVGKHVRKCFKSATGRVLVSADSDSNQLRGFAHYLNNKEVTEAIVDGRNEDGTDVHTRTANMVGVPRPVAKNVTYGLLFGAGDAKLAETAGMRGKGAEIRAKLNKAFPGFQELTENIQAEWEHNAYKHDRGFVTGLDGRRIFCEKHKAFNALLQAFEAVICKEACVQAQKMIEAEGLDAVLTCHYHDEFTYESSPEDAQRVGEIMEYGLGAHVTAKYNLNVKMGGTAQTGNNWSEIH